MLGMPTLLEFSTIKENIDFALENQLDFIELNYNMPYVQRELSSLRENRIHFSIHFYDDLDLAMNEPQIIDAYLMVFKRVLEESKHLNILSINVHLNTGPYTTIAGIKQYNYEKDAEFTLRLESTLYQMRKMCDGYGCFLCIENIITPKYLLDSFVYLANKGYNFTFDIGHDASYDESYIFFVKNNLSLIKEFHFHDATTKQCHLTLGEGILDLKMFYGLSKGKNVVLEVKEKIDLKKSIAFYRELGY